MENKKESKLNSDASSPLYLQLMQKIKNSISTGELKTGSRIQPEQELCSLYGVSRITVRKAITELEKEGILEKKQGKGTFVTVPAIHRKLHAVNSFHDTCRMNGKKPSTRFTRGARWMRNTASISYARAMSLSNVKPCRF